MGSRKKPSRRTGTGSKKDQILESLFRGGNQRFKDLLKLFKRATLSQWLLQLSEEGLIRRIMQGRVVLYTLTRAGRNQVIQTLGPSVVLQEKLSSEEVGAIREFYSRFALERQSIPPCIALWQRVKGDRALDLDVYFEELLIAIYYLQANALTNYPAGISPETLLQRFKVLPESAQAKRVSLYSATIAEILAFEKFPCPEGVYYWDPESPVSKFCEALLRQIIDRETLLQIMNPQPESTMESRIGETLNIIIQKYPLIPAIFQSQLRQFLIARYPTLK